MEKLSIQTSQRVEIQDITATIQTIVFNSKIQSGLITVYSPHTTAGITINENADPDVKHDMNYFLNKMVPEDANFQHLEGNSDAHIKGSLINFSQIFIIENGKIQLGTWQGIFFMEFDGPRNRSIWLKIIEA